MTLVVVENWAANTWSIEVPPGTELSSVWPVALLKVSPDLEHRARAFIARGPDDRGSYGGLFSAMVAP